MDWQKRVAIGKYRNRTYEWVAVCDPQYFAWLLRNCDCRSVRKWKRRMRRRLEDDSSDSS